MSEITNDQNKRKQGHDRAEVKININLATLGLYYLSKLTNISVGGAFIQHPNPEPVGTTIDLTFQLPNDDNPIKAKARVAWKYIQGGKALPNGTGMGITFTEISQEDQGRISAYIKSLVTNESETTVELSPDSHQENQSL